MSRTSRKSQTLKFPTADGAEDRRNLGAVYTPLWMARYIVDRSIEFAHQPNDREGSSSGNAEEPSCLRILDPACGDGVFLQAALERVLLHCDQTNGEQLQVSDRLTLVQNHVFGVDVDPQAVSAARRRLAQLVLQFDNAAGSDLEAKVASVAEQLSGNIVHANALLDARDAIHTGESLAIDWPKHFPDAWASGGFDIVVGNPPYVNIRRISQTYDEQNRKYLKSTFKTATGNFDLYVLFMELTNRLLRPGGVAGLIVPNKLGTLKYARACREMLVRDTSLAQIADVSQADVFRGTGVYPYIVIWKNEQPSSEHMFEVLEAKTQRELLVAAPRLLEQESVDADTGFAIHGELDLESRVATKPLSHLCKLHSGTTGFAAQKIAAEIVELDESTRPAFPFIVSGNIDRYRIDLGKVRYMKRKFARPGLPHESNEYSENKRRLYGNPKIVIAGLTKEIEAAWDDLGLALGVQVYAATDFTIDHWYVLAVLNSRLMTDVFRMRFNAKHLAGGYLAINKGQLELLPIAIGSNPSEKRLIEKIGQLAQSQHQSPGVEGDEQIDRLIDQLYQVTESVGTRAA